MSLSSLCEEKFSRAVKQHNMLAECSSILVGLSGGADSVVLLHILKKESALRGFSLYALHVNHMIRGDEADRDELFCQKLCEKLEIPFTALRADIPALAKEEKCGLEEAARNFRYKAFEKFCAENAVDKTATAHNASDVLETAIFNLARGSSLKGLSSIPPTRGNIIRPLILCSKSEILAYAEENSLEFVYDSTNSDTDYSRNLIRHNIIPEIKKINPAAEDTFSRSALLLREDSDFLDSMAESFKESSVSELKKLHPAILRRVIRQRYFAYCKKNSLSYTHITDVAELIMTGREHSLVNLPEGVSACIEGASLIFKGTNEKVFKKDYIKKLSLGENIIDEDASIIFICNENESDNDEIRKYLIKNQNIYKIFIKATTTFDIMNDSLFARSRKEGDRYFYTGMTRSVKKLLCEKKLPLDARNTLPIITDMQNIVWIPGFPVSDRFSVKKNQEKPRFSVYYMKGISENHDS